MQHDFQECEKEKDIFALENRQIRMSGKKLLYKTQSDGRLGVLAFDKILFNK